MIIRTVDAIAVDKDDERVYLADLLRESLAQENRELGVYQGKPSLAKDNGLNFPHPTLRWRSLNGMHLSAPIPGILRERMFGLGTCLTLNGEHDKPAV